jgi:membrane associated rhomboid family serine protease
MIIVPTEKRFDWQHAPLVLIAIVITNVLVFLLYQSGDNEKAYMAIEGFVNSGYVEKEWPIFEAFLEREGRTDELREYQRYQRQQDDWTLAQVMLMDASYYRHVQRAARSEFSFEEYERWKEPRAAFQDQFHSISSFKLGLKSTDVNIVTLFTHQFLHGGIGHIVGNMIFLLVFGFAVEAAIGHWRFLVFYLAGGVAAGLAQVVTTLGSDVPLVGASGAISGVMAMYLAVFRLKKIEFFYWVLFFVGYFRAPALLILPFYIGKEIYQYYTFEGSNVAFMAHAGGFVAGGILIGLALVFNRNMLNEQYIEEDQQVSHRDKVLADVYKAIENLRFDYALKLLTDLIAREGVDFDLLRLRFNLEKIKRGKNFIPIFRKLMTMKGLLKPDVEELNRLWLEEPQALALLPEDDQLTLAFQFTGLKNLQGAEQIFESLYEKKHQPHELVLLAKKLATRFADKHDHARTLQYQERAQSLGQMI